MGGVEGVLREHCSQGRYFCLPSPSTRYSLSFGNIYSNKIGYIREVGEHDRVISEIMGGVEGGAHCSQGRGSSLSPSTKYKIDEQGEERGNETETCSAKCDHLTYRK